ncbi:MAG: hypothetical protein HQL16_05100 [Candidatus Omnitrophica bacterium]|nr:hypothetical protein [Candidatus Omnitrophota bacterium]
MSMHYLFLNLEFEVRDRKLKALKANIFTSADAVKLDCEDLDGHKLSNETLKVALTSVPAMSVRKLVIVRRAEKLTEDNLTLIENFLKDATENPVLVLEAARWDSKTELKKNIRARVNVMAGAEKEAPASAFHMMDALSKGETVEALKTLKDLVTAGDAEEMILGAMIWKWSNHVKGRVTAAKYKKGLLILQEADKNVKRSRFPQREQAIEIALVKLSLLLKA